MTTALSTHAHQPFDNSWDFGVESAFGDEFDQPIGIVCTIKASSDAQAEERDLIYTTTNFDDTWSPRTVAESFGRVDESTYRVKISDNRR